MTDRPLKPNRLVSGANIFSRLAAGFVMAVGTLVLLGWLFDLNQLKSVYAGITMKANAALSLLLAGISLLLLASNKEHRLARRIGQVSAALVTAFGVLTLSEHFAGWNLGIDQFLFAEAPGALATSSPGRMGLPASSCFAMCGPALLLLYRRQAETFAQVLAIFVGLWALLAIVGYAYQAEELYGIARYSGIALHTAVALFVLSLGILAANPKRGLTAIICDEGLGGMTARRLLFTAITVPFLLGWLRISLQRAGFVDLGFGTALLVVGLIVILAAVAWQGAQRVRYLLAQQAAEIDERKRAEERLRESQRQYEALVQASAQIVWEMNAKGELEVDSSTWREFTGQTSEESKDFGWLDALHPDDRERVESEWRRAVSMKKGIEIEYRLRHQSGEWRWTTARATPMFDAAGSVQKWVGMNADITDRHKAEEERERLLRQEKSLRADAEQAARLKDEFLATVSHELRTPLNAILGWAAMLRSGKLDGGNAVRAFEVIERNAKLQAQLVEDLLDISRIISGKVRLDVKPIALVPAVKAAMDSLQPAADAKAIQLEMIDDFAGEEVEADEARLQQVIWNLLSNSVKFTPNGGRVMVKIDRHDAMGQITVTDNGEGISADFMPSIFDRFKQADGSITRKHGGMGLGLAIARHLMEMHGGTIEAASPGLEQGATFKIRLPLVAVRRRAPAPADSAKTAPPLRTPSSMNLASLHGIRVLIVDDEIDARELLRAVLEGLGADVTMALSAKDALEVLSSWKPDLLVSDIGMPEGDGYSLIESVRRLPAAEGGDIPAIALTGYVRVEERMRALAAGYQMFVPKPIEVAELAALIASLMERADQPPAGSRKSYLA